MGRITGFKNSTTGLDVGIDLVEKSYLIDRYPELADTFKQAGLWLWGENTNGSLGDGTNIRKSSPVQTVAGGANWKQVSASTNSNGGIKTDGTLWMWGSGSGGILGDGTINIRSSPVQTIASGINWKQIECSVSNTAAIKTDGTLWVWGFGDYGNLGDNTIANKSSPVQTIAGGTNWKLVACSYLHTAAIKTDGTLWLWGLNSNGNLGDNTTADKSSPIQTVAGGTNWKLVACGGGHTAAIKTDGTLWTWGNNSWGQLCNNTTVSTSSPIQTIAGGANWKQVAAARESGAAIKTDGSLWTWGRGIYGQIGNGLTGNRSSPVQTIAGGTNWKQVSSTAYSVAAIKTDGTLWGWGDNPNGELGDNTIANKSSPIQTVAGGTNWRQVSANTRVGAIRDDSADIFGNPV